MKKEEVKEKMELLLNGDFLYRLSEVAKITGWSHDYSEIRDFLK